MFEKLSGNVSSKIEGNASHKITTDPYVTISVSSAVIGRAFVIRNNKNPVWNQHFYVPVAHYTAEVQFVVKHSDIVGSQAMGAVEIPVEQLCSGIKLEDTCSILDESGEPCNPGAVLTISIQYTPIDEFPPNHGGVGSGPKYDGVPGTYFPLRRGGKVTLYQDAHVHEGFLPNLKLDHDTQSVHRNCWQDIFDAIRQARHLIYITGWSVYHQVRLVRDNDNAENSILGDLLKMKSQQGVRVMLLVWDDPTSWSILGYKTRGVMRTYDEETRIFFKHSSVKVVLCTRSSRKDQGWVKKQESVTHYSHHQKTVIVDADAGNNKRKIIAFVGGLDLCLGRYDTPKHPIFSTLQTVHKYDYHNPTFKEPIGPREPWHDLHCQIDGPAAYDILANFEERWLQASKPRGLHKLKISHHGESALLVFERISGMIGMADLPYPSEDDPESWNVQVFRSIDSNSVKGFPKDPKDATRRIVTEPVLWEERADRQSIHTAYVNEIRAAQRFIYIENQYFFGSSYNWTNCKNLGANNLVPMEIALKIVNKIQANERFSAYIVIPMFPEGDPTSLASQRILFYQHKTMQMMYEEIYKALEEAGLEKEYEPQDYLNFFCLGKREAPNREATSDAEDSTSARTSQIYGHRMSLWAEHIGALEGCFGLPESLECTRRVRLLSELSWKQYAAEEVTQMDGHLLKHPVEVDQTGRVNPLPGCEKFPDVGGDIVGSFIGIPDKLTI